VRTWGVTAESRGVTGGQQEVTATCDTYHMSLQIRKTTQRLFGQNSIDWLDRSYVVDWYIATNSCSKRLFTSHAHVLRFVVVSFWVLSWFASVAPVFERSFDLHDPLISHPHGKDQCVIRFSRLPFT
jgi:hypothetical protein